MTSLHLWSIVGKYTYIRTLRGWSGSFRMVEEGIHVSADTGDSRPRHVYEKEMGDGRSRSRAVSQTK